MEKNRLIVTGGCGFIGSNFIRYILEKHPEQEIVNVDKLTYSGNLNNLKDMEGKKNYSFVLADICDYGKMKEVIRAGDIIVNFAAESHVDNSIKDSKDFVKTNILGVDNLLQVSREKGVKLFLQVSTDEVYGSLKLYDRPSEEDNALQPSSPYSASKAAAEMLCLAAIKTFNQPIIISRSSNNFGPYQFPEKIVPLFITNIIQGFKVPLYGKGENIRDWIYVIDNCEAIDFVIKNGASGEIYNIGGGNEIANIDLTKKILANLGKDNLWINEVKDRPGHDLRYSLNCNKIKSLGWSPGFDFNDALKKTIQWYKDNESWWKPLKRQETEQKHG